MTTTTLPPAADPCLVLDGVASSLASGGSAALRGVLDRLVDQLQVGSAVLRDATGDLLAVGGDVVRVVPASRTPDPVVELPVVAGDLRLATLTVVGARAQQLPLLRAVCAVVGLSLAGPAIGPLPLALLSAADADADEAADALHDGPVQALVVARLVADAAVRGGDAVAARDSVQSALQSLRRHLWFLRPRGADGGLGPALVQLSDRLVEAGRPALLLDVDPAAASRLTPGAASVAYRLVQATAASADQAPSGVAVRRLGSAVELRLDPPGPLAFPERWTARARAVGGSLTTTSAGSVVLSVPGRTSPGPSDDDEAI